jgi:hypothetical protein
MQQPTMAQNSDGNNGAAALILWGGLIMAAVWLFVSLPDELSGGIARSLPTVVNAASTDGSGELGDRRPPAASADLRVLRNRLKSLEAEVADLKRRLQVLER